MMLDAFRRFCALHRLLPPGSSVLAAVSGGLDSMTLLHILYKTGFEVGVAHMNHGIRGNESDGEEVFIRQWCAQHQIRFYSIRVDAGRYAGEQGVSVQMAARELRYRWLEEIAGQNNYTLIATAHHLDDQAETLTAQFLRGRPDLAGIPVRNGKVVRPLLFAGRELIREFARKENISWLEDSSNAGDDYERNRIRHHLLPRFAEFNPDFTGAMGRLASRAQGGAEIFDLGLMQLREKLLQSDESEGYRISLSALLRFKAPASVLFWLLHQYDFQLSDCENMIAGVARQPGRIILGKGYQLVEDRDCLLLRKSCVSEDREPSEVCIDGPGLYALGNVLMRCSVVAGLPAELAASVAILDHDLLEFPLLWRVWKPGDLFVPLGMAGHQKVSDFLINQKVPRPDKNQVSVVTTGGQIAWLAGWRIGHQFRVTGQTRCFFRLEIVRSGEAGIEVR